MSNRPTITDPESERRAIVAVLEGAISRDAVSADLFYSLPPRFVTAVMDLAKEGPRNGGGLGLLAERLTKDDMAALGGMSRLADFVMNTIPVVSPDQQAKLIHRLEELRDRRAVFAGAENLARGAVDDAIPVDHLRAAALNLSTNLPERRAGRKTSWSLAELLTTEIDPPKWVVQGFIPAGLTILSGRPKSGKSFLSLQLAVAVAGGNPFLEHPTTEGTVLYIALEDSESRLQRRLRSWEVAAGLPLQIELAWPSLSADGLEILLRTISKLRPTLVIVDTLSRAFMGGNRRLDWNDQGDVTSVLAPLQSIAISQGLAVVLVDHHRKPSGMVANPIDDLLGSSAKSGVLDTALGLYRERLTGKGTLAITGRDVEEGELALQWDGFTCSWQMRGDARQIAADDAAADAIAGLIALGGSGDSSSVARETGKSRVAARNALERLVADGKVTRSIVGDRNMVIYSLNERPGEK